MPEAAAAGEGQPQQRGSVIGMITRMMFFWYMMSYFKGGNKPGAPVHLSQPLLDVDGRIDLYGFITEQAQLNGKLDSSQLAFQHRSVNPANFPELTETLHYAPSKAALNNGSIYMHVLVALGGAALPATTDALNPQQYFVQTKSLNHYMLERKAEEGVSLLSGDAAPAAKEAAENGTESKPPRKTINYWNPNVTINAVHYVTPTALQTLPPTVGSNNRA